MAFPTVLDVHATAKDYQTILKVHVHLIVQTLYPEGMPCISMIMHQ